MALQDFDDFDAPLTGGAGRKWPTVKFHTVGDKFVGVLVDVDDKYPATEYGSTKRKTITRDDGTVKELTQDLLTVLLMPATTAPVTDPDVADGFLPDVDGVVARVYVDGHNRWTKQPREGGMKPAWRNATDDAGDVYRRGCIVMGVFEATSDTGVDGRKLQQLKKFLGFAVRAAKPEEAPLVARARAEYRALKEQTAAATDQPRTPDYVRSGAPVPKEDEF